MATYLALLIYHLRHKYKYTSYIYACHSLRRLWSPLVICSFPRTSWLSCKLNIYPLSKSLFTKFKLYIIINIEKSFLSCVYFNSEEDEYCKCSSFYFHYSFFILLQSIYTYNTFYKLNLPIMHLKDFLYHFAFLIINSYLIAHHSVV